jgi:hypothetical protein
LALGKPTAIGDPDLRDALFLHRHPGWNQGDLDAAGERVLSLMSAIDNAERSRGRVGGTVRGRRRG